MTTRSPRKIDDIHTAEELVNGMLYRLSVPGGWIYQLTDAKTGRTNSVFVPDQDELLCLLADIVSAIRNM